jgi:putative Ig domain-containing protein
VKVSRYLPIGATVGGLWWLLLFTSPAYGQATVLQSAQFSNGFSGATNSLSVSFPKLTAGSTLLVQVESQCTAAPKVSDSNGRVYVMDVNESGTSGGVSLWHAINALTDATTITATLSSCNYSAMEAEEVSGLSGNVNSKAVNTVSGQNSKTFVVGTLTSALGDFLVAGGHNNYGVGGFIGESGFVFLPASMSPAAAEWKVANTTSTAISFGMQQPFYKLTGAAVAYSAGGTPPPPPPPPPPPQTCTGTATMTVNGVTPPALTMLSSFTMPTATVGTAYSASVGTAAQVSGGTPPYTYAIISGALPVGLSMNSAGTVSGTPTTAGTSTFGVQVTDSSGTAVVLDMKLVAESECSANVADAMGKDWKGCTPIAAETPR